MNEHKEPSIIHALHKLQAYTLNHLAQNNCIGINVDNKEELQIETKILGEKTYIDIQDDGNEVLICVFWGIHKGLEIKEYTLCDWLPDRNFDDDLRWDKRLKSVFCCKLLKKKPYLYAEFFQSIGESYLGIDSEKYLIKLPMPKPKGYLVTGALHEQSFLF